MWTRKYLCRQEQSSKIRKTLSLRWTQSRLKLNEDRFLLQSSDKWFPSSLQEFWNPTALLKDILQNKEIISDKDGNLSNKFRNKSKIKRYYVHLYKINFIIENEIYLFFFCQSFRFEVGRAISLLSWCMYISKVKKREMGNFWTHSFYYYKKNWQGTNPQGI